MRYNVTLLYFWLQNINLAIEHVKLRVAAGGHDIEEEFIKRRYINGIKNLFDIYFPIIDNVMIFDNSKGKYALMARKFTNSDLIVLNEIKYNRLKDFYHEKI